MGKRIIRIGTRDSQLALWQATNVKEKLESLGYVTELISVKSTGDLVLDKPLYEIGIQGLFTKTLDIALLNGQIDIAVHSMKDVPTLLPKSIVSMAVLERASSIDILVHKGLDFLETKGIIATSSLRRSAQWLFKYPEHSIVDLRGNVNTRLAKVEKNDWNGAIFAAAGLERINIKPEKYINLDWMIPAPAQGAMLVVGKEDDEFCKEALSSLNHKPTQLCVSIERAFLRTLEGGCTAPIGALASIVGDRIHFKGALFSVDGRQRVFVEKDVILDEDDNGINFAKECATEVINNGGKNILKVIKSSTLQ